MLRQRGCLEKRQLKMFYWPSVLRQKTMKELLAAMW
jgi:hypothetical protein